MRLGVSNLRPPVIRDYGDARRLIDDGRPLKDEPGVTPLTGRRRRNSLVAVYEGDRNRIHHGGLVCYTQREPVRVHTTDPVDLSKIATMRFRGILPNAAKTRAYLKEIGWYEFAAWADMVEKIGGDFGLSYAALRERSDLI